VFVGSRSNQAKAAETQAAGALSELRSLSAPHGARFGRGFREDRRMNGIVYLVGFVVIIGFNFFDLRQGR
jgi:hypothetical protein